MTTATRSPVLRTLLGFYLGVGLLCPLPALAGDLDATGADSYSLEDVYNRLNAGTTGTASGYSGPASGPTAGTMHTVNEIMGAAPSVDDSNGAAPGQVLSGKTFWGLRSDGTWGTTTGTLTDNGAGTTITPNTSDQTVNAGYWSSATTVQGDADLTSSNIKAGVNLFGIDGDPNVVDTGSGTAAAADIATGKKAWVGGAEVTGTATVKTVYPAPVACTGQGDSFIEANISFYRDDDGDWRAGVRRTGARFVDNGDGTVSDQLTGLVWLQNAVCAGGVSDWSTALAEVAELNSAGTMNGNGCGDTSNGGSHQSDWRLPNVNELRSLLDYGTYQPTIRHDAPFTNLAGDVYWSATTNTSAPYRARTVEFSTATLTNVGSAEYKTDPYAVAWAVRGTSAGPAPVAKTGQTTCYDTGGTVIGCAGTGQDGELQAGVAWPSPRFTTNGDGTVTDNLTGLIWLQNANCFGAQFLLQAVTRDTVSGGLVPGLVPSLKNGDCGLSDGSAAGDWRLPNVNELASLLDYGRNGPAFPAGHPFSNVQSADYWSSTYGTAFTSTYYSVSLDTGEQYNYSITEKRALWAVRGGE